MMRSILRNKTIYFVLGLLFIFVVWQIGSSFINNSYLLPSISKTFKATINLLSEGRTYVIFFKTILRLLLSLAICFTLALVLSSLSLKFKGFNAFLKPIMALLKTLPLVVLIILFLVLLKRELAVYFILALTIFPLLYEAFYNGFTNIDKNIFDEVKLVSGINFYVVKKVIIPLAFPYILVGLFQALGLGLKVMVMAEYISEVPGSIGYELMYYKDLSLETEYIFAWAFLLVIFVIITDLLLSLAKKQTLKNFSS